jgi:hypothetical protein
LAWRVLAGQGKAGTNREKETTMHLYDEETDTESTEDTVESLSPAGLTKLKRQAILNDFLERHDGKFDGRAFFTEVEADPNHPARGWFVWDQYQGWLEANLDRARSFTRGLTFEYTVQTIDRGAVNITVERVPFVHSPMAERHNGGGYVQTNPADKAHMLHLCQEAAVALTTWVNRYGAVVRFCGGSTMVLQRQIRLLEKVAEDGDTLKTGSD